jgi:hypothetical protein
MSPTNIGTVGGAYPRIRTPRRHGDASSEDHGVENYQTRTGYRAAAFRVTPAQEVRISSLRHHGTGAHRLAEPCIDAIP